MEMEVWRIHSLRVAGLQSPRKCPIWIYDVIIFTCRQAIDVQITHGIGCSNTYVALGIDIIVYVVGNSCSPYL